VRFYIDDCIILKLIKNLLQGILMLNENRVDPLVHIVDKRREILFEELVPLSVRDEMCQNFISN
jgi:hypothetical protein